MYYPWLASPSLSSIQVDVSGHNIGDTSSSIRSSLSETAIQLRFPLFKQKEFIASALLNNTIASSWPLLIVLFPALLPSVLEFSWSYK